MGRAAAFVYLGASQLVESQHSVQSHHGKRGFNGQSCFRPCSGDDDDDEEEEEEDFYLEKGYEVSGCSVLEGEMCSKVVGHVIGVATWQRCTYGAYLEDRKGEWTALICAHLAAHACAPPPPQSVPTPPEQTHRMGAFCFFFCIYFTVPGPSAKNTALTTGPLLSSGQPSRLFPGSSHNSCVSEKLLKALV